MCFLCRKDPSAFFSFPVTDLIAPGYALIIKRPMDFSTMKDKVKKECYQSLDELKVFVSSHTGVSLHAKYTHKPNIQGCPKQILRVGVMSDPGIFYWICSCFFTEFCPPQPVSVKTSLCLIAPCQFQELDCHS